MLASRRMLMRAPARSGGSIGSAAPCQPRRCWSTGASTSWTKRGERRSSRQDQRISRSRSTRLTDPRSRQWPWRHSRSSFGRRRTCIEFHRRLQITEPPIPSRRLDAGEPGAQRIEQNRAENPQRVNHWQAESNARRGRSSETEVAEEVRDWLAGHQRCDDGEDVRRDPLQKVEEQRYSAERDEHARKSGRRVTLGKCEKENARADRHHQIEQRRRVFRHGKKRQDSFGAAESHRPRRRIAVYVYQPDDDKPEHDRAAEHKQRTPPVVRSLPVERAERITGQHNRRPR